MADVEVVLVLDLSNVDHQCDIDQECFLADRCCKVDQHALRIEEEGPSCAAEGDVVWALLLTNELDTAVHSQETLVFHLKGRVCRKPVPVAK